MIISAPGKLVLSGAYAVLRGAPAIVTAVDRRVVADDSRPPDFRAPEVEAAYELLEEIGIAGDLPWYDAAALRQGETKLGLGSSAAICVASAALLLLRQKATWGVVPQKGDIADELYPLARQAHRQAQGGGSGIDVATACFGGTLVATLSPEQPTDPATIVPVELPRDLSFEVWGSPKAAATSDFVRRVLSWEAAEKAPFDAVFSRLTEASERAARAIAGSDASSFVAALRDQAASLGQLGEGAGVPIVLSEVATLAATLDQDSCFLPSGAGGGDVNVYVGRAPSSEAFREEACRLGLFPVPLSLGAPGVTWPA